VKTLARQALQYWVARHYQKHDVSSWPAWAGNVLDVKIPQNIPIKTSPSSLGGANVNILLRMVDQTMPLVGDCAECGVFRGSSLLTLGLHLKQAGSTKRIYGFDSFAGFDDAVEYDLGLGGAGDIEKHHGGFSNTSLDYVRRRAHALGLGDIVLLRQGYFRDALPREPNRAYSFVHLDCDIYESYRDCLHYFYPRLTPGAVVLLDEYNDPPWPGCNKAVDEFLQQRPEKLVKIESDGYQKYYFVKN